MANADNGVRCADTVRDHITDSSPTPLDEGIGTRPFAEKLSQAPVPYWSFERHAPGHCEWCGTTSIRASFIPLWTDDFKRVAGMRPAVQPRRHAPQRGPRDLLVNEPRATETQEEQTMCNTIGAEDGTCLHRGRSPNCESLRSGA